MGKIRYYIFAIRWLYRNRTWRNSRQKYKALDRDWTLHERDREARKAHRA